MAYLLDTDTCILAMSERALRLQQRIERAGLSANTSGIVIAELWYGIAKSQRRDHSIRQLHDFLQRLTIVEFDVRAGEHYGDIRAQLERAGTPIGGNDLFIAAHARSLDLTLVTNNRREFDRVPGLKVENWA